MSEEMMVTDSRQTTPKDLWPRLSFKSITSATSHLQEGFTSTIGMEGLTENTHLQFAVKEP
jgi:hypothetical protein